MQRNLKKILKNSGLFWPVLLVADFYSKFWARQSLVFKTNFGMSLGWLANSSESVVVASVVIMLIVWYQYRSFASRLILVGGLANLADRLANGAVTDWLHFQRLELWFNLADIYINLGLLLVIYDLFFKKHELARENNHL